MSLLQNYQYYRCWQDKVKNIFDTNNVGFIYLWLQLSVTHNGIIYIWSKHVRIAKSQLAYWNGAVGQTFCVETRYFGVHCSSATHFFGFEVPADKKSMVAWAFERPFWSNSGNWAKWMWKSKCNISELRGRYGLKLHDSLFRNTKCVMFLQFCINLNNYKMILLRVPFFWIYCILSINICIFLFILVVD